MGAEGLQNAVALGQERVAEVADYIGNTKHPLFQWVMTKKDKERLTYYGKRLPFFATQDGGETFFDYSDPTFRDYVPEESEAMRIYPANFAKSLKLKGDMLRSLMAGDPNTFDDYERKVKRFARAARQLLSVMFHGDGTGTLAISNSTINSTGAATLNCLYESAGTSAQAITKGAQYLRKNETYQAINPSTEAVRGTFTVTVEGKRSCSINVTAGTIAPNDKIVLVGSYKKVPNGLRQLANFANRVLQNYNTANNPHLNTPYYDMGGNAITPDAFKFAKSLVQALSNDENEANSKMIIMTFGHNYQLTSQGFQYRQYTDPKGNQTIHGVFSKYIDADGDVHFLDADAPDEQIRILDAASYHVGEEKPWGLYEGKDWEMIQGTNSAGSDVYFRAIGWHGQLYKEPRGICDAVIDDIAHSGADYPSPTYVA